MQEIIQFIKKDKSPPDDIYNIQIIDNPHTGRFSIAVFDVDPSVEQVRFNVIRMLLMATELLIERHKILFPKDEN